MRVELDGELLAESRRPLALFEMGLPTRSYLPAEDVREEVLEPETTIHCPFKGVAKYFSARVGQVLQSDLAWTHPDPIPENPRITNLIAFFNEPTASATSTDKRRPRRSAQSGLVCASTLDTAPASSWGSGCGQLHRQS